MDLSEGKMDFVKMLHDLKISKSHYYVIHNGDIKIEFDCNYYTKEDAGLRFANLVKTSQNLTLSEVNDGRVTVLLSEKKSQKCSYADRLKKTVVKRS